MVTLIERFYHWEKTTPDRIFLRQPQGSQWREMTYMDAGREARKMVTALEEAGLKKGDHIGIYSKNCTHWIIADLAIMMGGFVSVPLYPNLPAEQLANLISLGDMKAIFLGKLDDWGDRAQAVPEDVVAIKFPAYPNGAEVTVGRDWDALVEGCEPHTGDYAPDPDDLWTIKFTSGTTGTPKGVMHVHRSPAAQMLNELKTGWIGIRHIKRLSMLSYLPLNHVGERMGVQVPSIWQGGTISFVESLDTFAQNLRDTQPTVFFSVPRIWSKFYLGVTAKIPSSRMKVLLRLPILAGLLKRKLRTELGLRDVEVAATGAAITPAFVKDFFQTLGIHLVEAYGMTEVCGAITHGIDPTTPKQFCGKGHSIRRSQDTSGYRRDTHEVALRHEGVLQRPGKDCGGAGRRLDTERRQGDDR